MIRRNDIENTEEINHPIRVLHVIGVMDRGGAEAMIMNLYRNIDRNIIQFDFVEHFARPAAYDEEIFAYGGRIYRCPRYNGTNHFAYLRWWRTFWKEHHDEYPIVHGHVGSTAAIYLKEAKRYNVYTIAHSHSTNEDHGFKHFVFKLYSYPTRYIADYFFACSQKAGMKRYGASVSKDANIYSVLSNAIKTEKYRLDSDKRRYKRDELRYEELDWVIGHVGRFVEAKNHLFLIDIFSELTQHDSHARLLLVGDGPLRSQVEQKVRQLDLCEKVTFTGVREDVAELMQAMDILVFPSLYEGLPVTLVEAQAAGLPCVISDGVPQDAVITEHLVTYRSLADSAAEWAECIRRRKGEPRTDHSAEVAAKGFDIAETARWLEEFYLEKSGR